MVRFVGPQTLLHLGLRACYEGCLRRCFTGSGSQYFAGQLRPTVQPTPKVVNMLRRLLHVAKVREKQPRRPPRENGRERILPNLEINVRRRRGRQDVRAIVDANAGGVSHEGDTCCRIKVADMMRSMTRRV